MDPEAVIENARGSIDESLLTSTGGGLLGRRVLADEPLLAHLDDGETLQYLLGGAAAPSRVEDGDRQELETTGSYRTLLAVTDARLLVVAGSADGDRAVQFDYQGLADVEAHRGLLTDRVVLEEAAGPTWEVTVGTGSDVAAAAEYAAERAAAAGPGAADGPGAERGSDDAGGEGATLEDVTTAPDGSATIDSFLQDATTSESVERPAPGGGTDDPHEREPGGLPGGERPDATGSRADPRPGAGEPGATDDAASGDDQATGAAPVDARGERDPPAQQQGGTAPPSSRAAAGDPDGLGAAPTVEGPLAEALFGAVVEAASMPSVEGYASGDVERALGDLEAHHQRLRDHLAAGELQAARGAAATVEALAGEGARLAREQGEPEAASRVEDVRRATRGLLLAAALDLEDLSVLSGPEPVALKALLQGVDPTAFEHLVADLWSDLGYQTTVTQSSKDKGVDVVARQSTPVPQTVVIQAKRYGSSTKVGREEVQQYASLHRQEPDADLVVVVTTGEFTGPAREASSELDVKLVDGDRLVEILLDRDCYDIVARYA